jgi:copper(I)-binding protein
MTAHGTAQRVIGCALLVAVTAGCQATAIPKTDNRGAGTDKAMTAVENAYLVPAFVPGSCALQAGDAAKLSFTVINNRSIGSERLTAIVTDAAANVVVPAGGTAAIPPGEALALGQPRVTGAHATELPAAHITGLRPQVKAGTSVIVTFTFADAGQLTMKVPVEACPAQE